MHMLAKVHSDSLRGPSSGHLIRSIHRIRCLEQEFIQLFGIQCIPSLQITHFVVANRLKPPPVRARVVVNRPLEILAARCKKRHTLGLEPAAFS